MGYWVSLISISLQKPWLSLADAVKNTHWILARRVSNEIAVMRAFFFFFPFSFLLRELKLVKVIQSSAARYVRAGLFLRVEKTEGHKKKKKKCSNACLSAHVVVFHVFAL